MKDPLETADPGWRLRDDGGPLIATAVHDGHRVRPEVAELLALGAADRLREEDPFTGGWAELLPTHVVATRSRFEVDLNRPRENAVYRLPDDAWGLEVWKRRPADDVFKRSLELYDEFYAVMRKLLAGVVAEHGCFVVLDLHSYNHRRGGVDAPYADREGNPQVNIGTGSMDRVRWAPVVDAFADGLRSFDFPGGKLDVRENVKFFGGHLSRWVHDSFPDSGVAIAIELKKFFMDEWTGVPDKACVEAIGNAIKSTIPAVLDAHKSMSKKARSTTPEPAVIEPPNRTARSPSAASTEPPQEPIKIGFVVNDVMTEEAGYTTTRLGCEAVNRGHEVYVFGVGDIAYDADERVRARARSVPKKKYGSHESYCRDLQGNKAVHTRITVDDLDVLMLRNVPSDDYLRRPWAASTAAEFGRLAVLAGVVVVNDPSGLAKASTKMYFQLFPPQVRPRTLITRDRDDIKAFARDEGRCVLKPLQGSGGANVFLVEKSDIPNLNQMIDAVSRDGFVIAQEYLPAAEDGDLRLFLMNGRPLQVKGKYAAFRRVRRGGDMRSNIHAGGKLAAAQITAEHLKIAEIVRPKLVEDGMFLVGLDIVGDKLIEINVFSPGGLGSAQMFTKINFNRYVINALVRKANYMKFYGRSFDNMDMCTL